MSLLILLRRTNWIILFFSLEFNIIIFLWILKKRILQTKIRLILKYFLFQRFNTLILIICIILIPYIEFYSLIFLLLLLKIGLPPFHVWLIILIKYSSLNRLIYLIVLQKIPFFILIFYYTIDININLLIDIGANTGQYAIKMRNLGYDKKIISFKLKDI